MEHFKFKIIFVSGRVVIVVFICCLVTILLPLVFLPGFVVSEDGFASTSTGDTDSSGNDGFVRFLGSDLRTLLDVAVAAGIITISI
jgi:hypothetical protein